MAVDQTNSVNIQKGNPLSYEGKPHLATPTLQDVFAQDSMEKKAKVNPVLGLEASAPSFWSRLASWFSVADADVSTPTEAPKVVANKPIELLPELEIPEDYPPELEDAFLTPPPQSKRARKAMTQHELDDIIALLSDKTIEEIMSIVVCSQMELDKENANVVQDTFQKYQNIRKLQDKVLEQIKDALEKDQNFLSKCQTAQSIAIAASFISGIAVVAAASPLLAVVAPAVIFSAIAGVAAYGPAAAATATGLATASRAYSQRRLNEDQAKHDKYSHHDKSLSNRIDEACERLMTTAETDEAFKETMMKLLKRMSRMNQLVIQK
jgi:hypothetical protein